MITESISCVSDCSVAADPNTIRDIQLDLESFTFGLSELYMLADKQSEFAERIVLLKKCVEDTKSKIYRLVK